MIDRYERQLEAEALLHELNEQPSCPGCRRKIDVDFVACPYCRAKLRTACESCGRPLAQTWAICPYCAAERREPAQPPRAAPAALATSAAEGGRARAPRLASTATYTPPAPQRPATGDAPADAPGT